MEDQSFHPYIPADRVAPEMTAVSVLLGAVLAIVFGAANAYLGLRVGMTISASIPAAVLSMGLTRFILKRDSIWKTIWSKPLAQPVNRLQLVPFSLCLPFYVGSGRPRC